MTFMLFVWLNTGLFSNNCNPTNKTTPNFPIHSSAYSGCLQGALHYFHTKMSRCCHEQHHSSWELSGSQVWTPEKLSRFRLESTFSLEMGLRVPSMTFKNKGQSDQVTWFNKSGKIRLLQTQINGRTFLCLPIKKQYNLNRTMTICLFT